MIKVYYGLLDLQNAVTLNPRLFERILSNGKDYLNNENLKEELASVVVPIFIKLLSFEQTNKVKVCFFELAVLIIEAGTRSAEFDNVMWSKFDSVYFAYQISKIGQGFRAETSKKIKILCNTISSFPGKLVGFMFIVLSKFSIGNVNNTTKLMELICETILFDRMDSSDLLCFMEELRKFVPFFIMKVTDSDEVSYMNKLERFTTQLFRHVSEKLKNDQHMHYNYQNYYKSIEIFIDKLFAEEIAEMDCLKNADLKKSFFSTLYSLFDEILREDEELAKHNKKIRNPGFFIRYKKKLDFVGY